MAHREQMNIVVVGHVDHGKSTVIGRLLADTGSLPQGKLEQVKIACKRNARPFEYAFLLDALKDEQAQGITIDTARCFFKTEKRDYIIIDAPGHVEFLKNMVSGAARAEAALLVIDAQEGIQENSRRHGYLVSMLGIYQIVVLVNKMDLIHYRRELFESISTEYCGFLEDLGIKPIAFVPISARNGDNLAAHSKNMPWYSGCTVLEHIDAFMKKEDDVRKPFRMPVQDVYKFTEAGDDRRIIAGTVESGSVSVGDEIIFQPSGKRSKITTIEAFNAPGKTRVSSGYATGFTIADELYIKHGEIMCRIGEPQPIVASRFRANVFWMGAAPLVMGRKYKLKIGTARAYVRMTKVVSCIDATDLSSVSGKQQVDRHDVAECVFESVKPIAFDAIGDNEATSRFVLVDNYDIVGGGIIIRTEDLIQPWIRRHVKSREFAWEEGEVTASDRVARNGHHGKSIVFCGDIHLATTIAKMLERALFDAGFQSYYSGLGNIRAGFDSDVDDTEAYVVERIIHLGEIARLLTDAGLIFITVIDNADEDDVAILRKLNEPYEALIVRVGGEKIIDNSVDIALNGNEDVERCVDMVVRRLRSDKIIPEYSI